MLALCVLLIFSGKHLCTSFNIPSPMPQPRWLSHKLYMKEKSNQEDKISRLRPFRINLLPDARDDARPTLGGSLDEGTPNYVTGAGAQGKYVSNVTPKALALGSVATLSAGTIFWALLKPPNILDSSVIASSDSLPSTASRFGPDSDMIGIANMFLRSIASAAALPTAAFLLWKFVRVQDEQAFQKELNRIQQYKEEMYFEAVQDILMKLNSWNTSFSSAENLRRQLIVLDPDGSIREYVISGGARPDISALVQSNAERYSKQYKMRKEGEEASDTSSSEIDLPRLLNQIDATLSKKCDSSTRQKIVSKIKDSFGNFDSVQAKEAFALISANIDNEKYWAELIKNMG